MSEKNNIYQPLGLNAWSGRYLQEIKSLYDADDDPMFDYHTYDGLYLDRYREVATSALLNELAYRTSRNHRHEGDIEFKDSAQAERFKLGENTPSEGIEMLHKQSSLRSIELARHRHVGDWDGSAQVVEAVEADIASNPDLSANTVDISGESQSYYRITGYDVADPGLQKILSVTRKREILSHYDDSIVSVLAETYAVDATSDSFSPEVREQIVEEFTKLESLRKSNPSEADKWTASHHNFVGVAIDSLAKRRRKGGVGEATVCINGAVPLTTAIYAASRTVRPKRSHSRYIG